MRVKNKDAVITGAAYGQGASEAKLLASEGATIIVADIREELGLAVVSEIEQMNGLAEYFQLDVRDEKNWHDVISRTVDKHERIDILINNAAISGSQPDLLRKLSIKIDLCTIIYLTALIVESSYLREPLS